MKPLGGSVPKVALLAYIDPTKTTKHLGPRHPTKWKRREFGRRKSNLNSEAFIGAMNFRVNISLIKP
jgi:hypothetical protein